jgi:hypothetical protein
MLTADQLPGFEWLGDLRSGAVTMGRGVRHARGVGLGGRWRAGRLP